ncbi:MAG: hypothetical protein JXM79_04255, partial [Sedimentisphaerales bacterium]|nr:hypothetical protein [Sedimentisphaerales bacterium]
MSKMFPNAYAVFFVVQIAILMVAYVILRLKTKYKMLTTLCLSILFVAGATLLLLPLNRRFLIRMNPTDLQEYVAGTFFVAVPFILILIVTFLKPMLREIVNTQKPAGPERTRILQMVE